MSDQEKPADGNTIKHSPATSAPTMWKRRPAAIAAVAGIAILGIGAVAGAGAASLFGRHDVETLLPPVAVTKMTDGSTFALKGKVVEIYGNKFVIDDGSGRALVETGRAGGGGTLVAPQETVTVQGRFEDGFVHGSMIVHGDNRTDVLKPAGGPPPPPHLKDWLRRH